MYEWISIPAFGVRCSNLPRDMQVTPAPRACVSSISRQTDPDAKTEPQLRVRRKGRTQWPWPERPLSDVHAVLAAIALCTARFLR